MVTDSSTDGDRFRFERQLRSGAGCKSDLVDHVELVFERQAARTWEANTPPEQVFGHLSAVALAPGVEELEVHGFPDGAGFDVGGIQGADEFIARTAELFLIDEEAAQPVRVQAVGGLGHERDTGQAGEGLAIAERDGTTLLHAEIENLKLATADPRPHIAHPGAVAKLRVLG